MRRVAELAVRRRRLSDLELEVKAASRQAGQRPSEMIAWSVLDYAVLSKRGGCETLRSGKDKSQSSRRQARRRGEIKWVGWLARAVVDERTQRQIQEVWRQWLR